MVHGSLPSTNYGEKNEFIKVIMMSNFSHKSPELIAQHVMSDEFKILEIILKKLYLIFFLYVFEK